MTKKHKTNAAHPHKPETETDPAAEPATPPPPAPDAERVAEPAPEPVPAPEAAPDAAPEAAPETDGEPAPSPLDALRDQYLRLQADFDNFRKRIDRERKDWSAFAAERIVSDLLPVLDNFDLGIANGEKAADAKSVLDGFRIISSQLETVLKNAGATLVDATGQEFDPNLHEALTYLPSPDVPEGHVIHQSRRGCLLGSKLLRPAQVVVSSGPPA